MSDFFEEFEKFCEDYKSWRREGISESESFDIDEDEEVLEFISDDNEDCLSDEIKFTKLGILDDIKEPKSVGFGLTSTIYDITEIFTCNKFINFVFRELKIKLLNDFVDVNFNSVEFVVIDEKKKFKNVGNILKLLRVLGLVPDRVFKIKLHKGWGRNYKKDAYEISIKNSFIISLLEEDKFMKFIENIEKAKELMKNNFEDY